jgi:hypothetical protein
MGDVSRGVLIEGKYKRVADDSAPCVQGKYVIL